MTYALPSVWFWVAALPVLSLLVLAHVQLRKSNLAEDAIWRRLQQKLDGLNRPSYRPSSPSGIVYAGSAVSSACFASPEMFETGPGARWLVSHPTSVQHFIV